MPQGVFRETVVAGRERGGRGERVLFSLQSVLVAVTEKRER